MKDSKTWKDDCHISVIDPRAGKGGQHVGTSPLIVRVVHEPTGITAECGEARSQFKNREIAMSMIQWALVNLNFSSEYTK
jgi:protein subunit release factor A